MDLSRTSEEAQTSEASSRGSLSQFQRPARTVPTLAFCSGVAFFATDANASAKPASDRESALLTIASTRVSTITGESWLVASSTSGAEGLGQRCKPRRIVALERYAARRRP